MKISKRLINSDSIVLFVSGLLLYGVGLVRYGVRDHFPLLWIVSLIFMCIAFYLRRSRIETLQSHEILTNNLDRPFTVFMNRDDWQNLGPLLNLIYNESRIHRIKKDGSFMALEVL